MRYVITGCAASGTAWAHKVMTGLGSPCGHQRAFGRFAPRHDREGESSWMAIGQLPDVPTLLLIRNPLHVVRSIVTGMGFLSDRDKAHQSNDHVRRHLPEVFDAPDRLGRILRYVAWWDTNIEPDEVQRIEDVTPERTARLFWALTGRPASIRRTRRVLMQIGTNVNTHNGHRSTLTWDDVANHPDGAAVIAKAERWGYL